MRIHVKTVPVALLLAFVGGWAAMGQSASGTTPQGLFYEVSGSGEPLVFIHAFSVDRRMWAPQIEAFEGRFRVVRYDLRGHGKSVAPKEAYTGYGDLVGLLDAMEIRRATLVGLSAGAELAINFAIAHPNRTAAIVVAAPGLGGYRTPPLPWATPVFQAAGSGDAKGAARLWAETPIMALHNNRDAASTVTGLVMDNWQLWTYRRTEQPLTPPAVGRLAEIRSPALIVVGDKDLPHIHEVAQLLAKEIAGARLVRIPAAGHIVNLDAPAAFNEALGEFLKRP